MELNGYKLIVRKDREDTTDGRGGGILIFSKSELRCHEIEVHCDIIQRATVQIKLEDCDLNLHAIYRSPNSSVENNSKINDFIRSLTVNSIVVGDFNHPSVNWELQTSNQQHSREFMEAVNDAFLTQHVDFPTHDGGNLLDLVLSNIPNRVRQVIEKGKLGNTILLISMETH